MISGVLFDFSGTLFRLEPNIDDLLARPELSDAALDADEVARAARLLTAPSGLGLEIGETERYAWENRDLDPELHRSAYSVVLTKGGIRADLAEALYEHMIESGSWRPYPDTVVVLKQLADAGIPVAVVSNIAWDIRPVLRLWQLDGLVSEVLMSYVEGMIKPNPQLFVQACARLGVPPEHTMMVGDSAEADGAATEIGCRFALVDPAPTEQRPNALVDALARHGVNHFSDGVQ